MNQRQHNVSKRPWVKIPYLKGTSQSPLKSADASRACRRQSATWSSFGISSQSRRLLGLPFFGHAVLGVQNPVFFPVLWVFRAKKNTCRLGLWGGGGAPPDAQDLHPQHHQDCLVAMNLSLFFAHILVTSGVLLLSDVGIGLIGVWVGPSAVELLNFAKMGDFCNSRKHPPHCRAFGSLLLWYLRGVASICF